MKPNPSSIAVESSLPIKGRKMDFDPDSIAHIMRLLIDLYSDKELAIIRELSTNAIDSHIMAGVQEPIIVQTPTPLSPYLTIQDQGLGLDVEEIYALFGRYGASTKRDTNAATGMLGLGSKSPLTYTNQFTMTAIKDGDKSVVAIMRDEDGVGNLTVVDTSATKEPNGVTIKIPAKTGNSIERKAKEFFSYWQPGDVLLNGKDPSGLGEESMKISDNIFLLKGGGRYDERMSHIVMGNVPYPAPGLTATALGLHVGHYVVAYVPIGDVDFAPSREALQDSKKTRDTMERVIQEFRTGLNGAVQRDIDRAATGFDALKRMETWRTLFNGRNSPSFSWKGRTLPWTFDCVKVKQKNNWGSYDEMYPNPIWQMDKWYAGYGRSRSNANKVYQLPIHQAFNGVFITGFDQEKPTPTVRRKATQWLEHQTTASLQGVTRFYLLNFTPEAFDLIPGAHKVAWATIKAEKLPKADVSTSARIPGSFDIVLGGEKNRVGSTSYRYAPTKDGVPGDDLDQTNPIYWFWGNQNDGRVQLVDILDSMHKAYTLICLPANRLDKFKRDNPKIEEASAVIEREAKKISSKMTATQKQALWMRDNRQDARYARWERLVGQILDPEFKKLIELSTDPSMRSILAARDRFRTVRFPMESVKNYELITQRYPLAASSPHPDQHELRYVNHEYTHLMATGAIK